MTFRINDFSGVIHFLKLTAMVDYPSNNDRIVDDVIVGAPRYHLFIK